jgi:acetolactate synthase-1/2/3 large subunit
MELSDYRSFWDTWNHGKGFTLHDQDVQALLVDITKMRNLMNLSSVIKNVQILVIIQTNFKHWKVKEAAELINNAKKPFYFFGQGVILGQAEEEFKAFVEKSGIPAAGLF